MADLDVVPEVTIKNVVAMDHTKMLNGLKPYCLKKIPEGIIDNPSGVKEVDHLIGYFANLYAYMMFLFAHVASEQNKAKLIGDDETSAILTKKKDALFELARAVRYKQEACSRMLTAQLREADDDEVFDQPNHQARRGREQSRREMKGWSAVKS